MTKSKGIMRPRHRWTPLQLEALREWYPDTPAAKIAETLGLTLYQVYNMAHKLGLKKSAAFLSSLMSPELGAGTRYPKGNVPVNKGIKGTSYPGMEATQFKKGRRPQTWKPLGSERYGKDGYLQRKATDTGYAPRDWVGAHILLWVQHNGPVPKGHCIIFKDGDKRNITINNLECITRAENMKRNTIHNLPEELKEVLQLKGALNRRITCHERNARRKPA